MKRPSARGATRVAPADVLADRGREALRAGRFKEAVEVFKQLVRQDKCPEWSGHLGDAYAGRARALADKGMFKEAAMVLENTLPFGATIREPVLYLTCLIRQGSYQKARQTALSCLSQLPPAEADCVAGVAALLSLAVPAPGAPPGLGPAGDGWTKASEAAQATLGAWLQGKPPEEVDRLLAGIPLRSPFGPLRLILKSLTTPSDAASKARGLLAMSSRLIFEFSSVPRRKRRWPTIPPSCWQPGAACGRRSEPSWPKPAVCQPPATALLNQILDAERRGPAALFALLDQAGSASCRRTNSVPPASTCCRRSRTHSPAIQPPLRAAHHRGAEPCPRSGSRDARATGSRRRIIGHTWPSALSHQSGAGRAPRTGGGAAPPGRSGTAPS